MSITVKTVTGLTDGTGATRFYVIESRQDQYPVVLGRKFWVRTTLEHYVYPGAPHKNFTDRIVMVFTWPGMRCIRFSRSTMDADGLVSGNGRTR